MNRVLGYILAYLLKISDNYRVGTPRRYRYPCLTVPIPTVRNSSLGWVCGAAVRASEQDRFWSITCWVIVEFMSLACEYRAWVVGFETVFCFGSSLVRFSEAACRRETRV